MINSVRRDNRENPSLKTIRARMEARQNCKDPARRERYAREDQVAARATELFDQYGAAGATWGACVQAVKTDWVVNFQEKWSDRARALKAKKG